MNVTDEIFILTKGIVNSVLNFERPPSFNRVDPPTANKTYKLTKITNIFYSHPHILQSLF